MNPIEDLEKKVSTLTKLNSWLYFKKKSEMSNNS